MEEVAETSPLQFLLIELSLGLARSAIQAGPAPQWRRRRGPSPVLRKEPGGLPVNLVLLKWAFASFGAGLFIAGMTFVHAYVAQGAIAYGPLTALGNSIRRLGLT